MGRHFKAEINENTPLNKNHCLLTFTPLEESPEPEPGQFYMLSSGSLYDPLLKRPFCFFRKKHGAIQILYRIKGRGTALLREMKKGAVIEVLGPLGNSYPIPKKGQTPLIIAGGVGIASVFPLIDRLGKKAYVLYGAKGKDELLMLDEIEALAGELHVSTDDGSYGLKGNVCGLLSDFLRKKTDAGFVLYACGPRGMLKAVSEIAAENAGMGSGTTAYVSLEENMACGVGACLGCAVLTKEGYKRVCKEGPVFSMGDIVL